jgi:hypothetical protein
MQPFTRDGARLPSIAPRREHSLGPVGSGRRRQAENLWNGLSRSLVFAEIDDQDSDDETTGPPPTRSGATSRRHSLATLPGRSQVGFQMPDILPLPAPDRFSTGPRNLYEDTRSPHSMPSTATTASGLRFDDDELADSLNSLQLNIDNRQPEHGLQSTFQCPPVSVFRGRLFETRLLWRSNASRARPGRVRSGHPSASSSSNLATLHCRVQGWPNRYLLPSRFKHVCR